MAVHEELIKTIRRTIAELSQLPHLKLVELIAGDYYGVRVKYYADIQAAATAYMTSEGSVTAFQNAVRRAMVEAFPAAFEIGYKEGGGDMSEDPDADAWLTAKMEAEYGFIGMTFQRLKQIRASDDVTSIQDEPYDVADRYCNTLDGVYNEGRIRGAGNQMLTFGGPSGKESCNTCQRLMDVRHRASWFVSHDLVPGKPGSEAFECGGWQCEHYLFDDNGRLVTL